MQFSTVTRLLAITSTLACASAVAQSRFCIGGDLDRLSATQRTTCAAKLQVVKETAAAFHAPENWHFVVVCGEEGWQSYAAFSAGSGADLQNASADTHFAQHETFLREGRLDLNNLRMLRRVVAHEVAGIVLHTTDEMAIDQQISTWQNGPQSHEGY